MGLPFYVYILASHTCGDLYTGHTDNLQTRILQHKHESNPKSYTARTGIKRLVHYEKYPTRIEAKRREAILKKLSREKKFRLIEKNNPNWEDLAVNWQS